MSTTYDYLFENDILNNLIDVLTIKQFIRESNTILSEEYFDRVIYSEINLSKAVFFASILALSKNDNHQQKALAFSILAYLEKKDITFSQFCYIILSRTNNIHQGRHLVEYVDSQNDQFLRPSDVVLDMELSVNRSLSKLILPDMKIHLNQFQKTLWDVLSQNDLIAISAPTSSGKSFMIQNYLVDNYVKAKQMTSLYIVPTKALIYEVSANLRKRLNMYGVEIKNYIDEEKDLTNKVIYVVTPERCANFLKLKEKRHLDFIFFDEIQNLEDGERGATFEYVFNELRVEHPDTQLIVAGPYLNNLDVTISKLCDLGKPSLIESHISPVYQTKAIFHIRRKTKNIDVTLKSYSGNNIKFKIKNDNIYYSGIKNKHLQTLPIFVMKYGNESINIIYAPTRYSAEQYAINISDYMDNIKFDIKSDRIKELMDFLSNDIHPKYSLVRCLKKGVAFHHGTIPEIAKIEIEEMYKEGLIQHLSCTSTLLQGVNLPADKMFIYRPFKKDKNNPLDNFEFGNLIGRAGRASSKLNGSVYCFELYEEPWAEEKLSSDFSKEIIPLTEKAFTQHLNDLIENIYLKTTEMISDRSVVYTIILLRQKAIKNKKTLMEYLLRKGITGSNLKVLYNAICESVDSLELSGSIISMNHHIDPLLQNDLYLQILNDGLDSWLITKHPLSSLGIRSTHANFIDKTFYYQFREIVHKLNNIFDIEWDISNYNFQYGNLESVIYYAVIWMEQNPIRVLVSSELKYKKDDSLKTVDKVIRDVIKKLKEDVSFKLVKYFKLLSDIMSYMYEEDDLKGGIISSISEMIEFGASNVAILNMIRSGINRSAAIELEHHVPFEHRNDPMSWIMKNDIPSLSALHRRNLINQGFWDDK